MAKQGSKIDLRQFEQDMLKALSAVENVAVMKKAGELMVDRVVKRTRLGKGVSSTGADPQSLKPLSSSYKEQRKGNLGFFTDANGVVHPYRPGRKPELSSTTSPGKSNLTRTGRMLASIKVILARAGSVIIGPTGGRTGTRLNNEDVARLVQKDRPFLKLSKPELAGLTRFFRDELRAALRKALT